ncbi:unnamed protein product, partial [Owenia fusiformis]
MFPKVLVTTLAVCIAIFVRGSSATVGYDISVWTMDAWRAGTDATVFVILYGHKGTSSSMIMDSAIDDFERGSVGSYALDTGVDYGVITKIRIGHDNAGARAGWKFEMAQVTDRQSGTVTTFTCDCWVDSSPYYVETLAFQVHGVWSDWSFDDCSVTCGGGTQSGTRACDNPPPSGTGAACTGDSFTDQSCNTNECPINGGWNEWSEFGSCSSTCGGGTKTRSRSCD